MRYYYFLKKNILQAFRESLRRDKSCPEINCFAILRSRCIHPFEVIKFLDSMSCPFSR